MTTKGITLLEAVEAVGKFLNRSPQDSPVTAEELACAERVLIRVQELRIAALEKKFAHDPIQRGQAINRLINSFLSTFKMEPAQV